MSEAGHVCDVIEDGRNALFQASHEQYDVLAVDRMLPGLDGLSICTTDGQPLRATRCLDPFSINCLACS